MYLVFVFMLCWVCACDNGGDYNSWKSEPEYTGEEGELGGKCILPHRICNCYPQCYCDGSNFTCRPMPDKSTESNDDSPEDDSLLESDDDIVGPPDGWGGQENTQEGLTPSFFYCV